MYAHSDQGCRLSAGLRHLARLGAGYRQLPAQAGLQRDIAFGIEDIIYKIDVESGRSSLVGSTDVNASMTRLRISSDGRILYFINESTGLLQSMHLK